MIISGIFQLNVSRFLTSYKHFCDDVEVSWTAVKNAHNEIEQQRTSVLVGKRSARDALNDVSDLRKRVAAQSRRES